MLSSVYQCQETGTFLCLWSSPHARAVPPSLHGISTFISKTNLWWGHVGMRGNFISPQMVFTTYWNGWHQWHQIPGCSECVPYLIYCSWMADTNDSWGENFKIENNVWSLENFISWSLAFQTGLGIPLQFTALKSAGGLLGQRRN